MFPPMCPKPTKPTFVVVVAISCPPFDHCDVVLAELEVGGVDDRICLVWSAEADDRAVDGRVAESPGDRGRAGGDAVALRHGLEALDERKPLAEPRLLEAWVVLAPVVLGQAGDPLAGHRTGQQAGAHRRVDDHADPLALGEGKDLPLGLAVDERVGWLQRLDRRDLLDAPELSDAEVGDADVANESLLLEFGEGTPPLFDLLVGDRPVDLVEVDRLEAEALQAAFELAPERVAPQALQRRPVWALGLAGFREHVRTLRRIELAQGASDDFLRMAEAILRCRVDPVDAELDRVMDRRDRVLVFLGTPAPVIAAAPDRPGAEADASDLETGRSELGGLELCLLHWVLLSVRQIWCLSGHPAAPPSAALMATMIAPPSVTETNEPRKPVSKKRERIQERLSSSNA